MATRDLTRSGLQASTDGNPVELARAASAGGFESVLWEQAPTAAEVDAFTEPDFFGDFNLDQALEAVIAGRAEYELKPFFYPPLHDPDAVQYRHEVFQDLEKPEVRTAITRFAEAMQRTREHLAQVKKLHYRLQKEAWFLDAVDIYCDAVPSLADELGSLELGSRGLRGFRDYLGDYTRSNAFTELASETRRLKEETAGVRYAVHINGARVTVSRYEGESDYGAKVEKTFARFEQGAVKSYLVQLRELPDMDHVEARILGLVAKLYPEVFGELARYFGRRSDFLDTTVARFDREVQFYLAYLDLVGRLRAGGLPFCYPCVSARSKAERVEDTFDLALASKLVADGEPVVTNDFFLEEPERVFVVSGPNNGGKTTFARAFGQLHHLAALGLLVPGRAAQLFLPDRIYTHFEREEDIETLRGKFEDELVRVHEILEQATASSVIVMNESFNSTTLNDALFVGSEVMRRILALGCLGLYVTFVEEIASLSDATVSMVSQIVPENPAERTFKLLRKPPDGLAYAWAIAQKYGLTYDRLLERID